MIRGVAATFHPQGNPKTSYRYTGLLLKEFISGAEYAMKGRTELGKDPV
jgi:hypothetical protein